MSHKKIKETWTLKKTFRCSSVFTLELKTGRLGIRETQLSTVGSLGQPGATNFSLNSWFRDNIYVPRTFSQVHVWARGSTNLPPMVWGRCEMQFVWMSYLHCQVLHHRYAYHRLRTRVRSRRGVVSFHCKRRRKKKSTSSVLWGKTFFFTTTTTSDPTGELQNYTEFNVLHVCD